MSWRRHMELLRTQHRRWIPWGKDTDNLLSGPSTPSAPTTPDVKPRPAASGDEFLKSMRKVARGRGLDAAEQMINIRSATLWSRLSMLAEPTDPARALDYAERYSTSVSGWISWLQRSSAGGSGDEYPELKVPDGAALASVRDEPPPEVEATKPPLPVPHDRLLQRMEWRAKTQGLDLAEQLIAEDQAKAWMALSKLAEPSDRARALEYAERAFALHPASGVAAQKIARLLFAQGDLVLPERVFRTYIDAKGGNPTPQELQRLAMMQGWKTLFLNGFPLPEGSSASVFEPIPDKIIYCLHNSLPQSSGGYAIRSHGLLRALQAAGISAIGLTRYGYPWDIPENIRKDPRPDFPLEDIIEEVTYRRLRTLFAGRHQIPMDRYIQICAEEIEAIARIERPSVIHAASFFWVGLAAVVAARRLGLPVLYEVRGLWEVTQVSRHLAWEDSELYRTHVQLETRAAMAADRVITITNALKDEFVRRGVPAERITVVPNCVELGRFVAAPRDRELEQRLGLEGKRVVGYVGSFTDYEGLDHLLYAATVLVDQGIDDFHLLLVGDGPAFRRLKALVSELELADYVTLSGRVPFDEVHRYYSLIDVAPFPRIPLPVTEMVSPLKPFEAMAMEKAVLVSSVAALAEIVEHGTTGLVFEKGNLDDLAAALKRLVTDPELCARLGKNAREWVGYNRAWERAGLTVADLYRTVARDQGAASCPHGVSSGEFG